MKNTPFSGSLEIMKNAAHEDIMLIGAGYRLYNSSGEQIKEGYDMPKEFAKLAAQDMGKVGAMQDLVRGVEKLVNKKAALVKETVKETVVVQQSGDGAARITAAMDRGFMALEDGEWNKAVSFFDQVLSLDAKNARAYYGMALAKAQCRDADVYINMLCSGTPRAENIELPRDEKHIREAAEKYAVPGYLNAEEIRALYDYKPSYHGPVVATGAGGADRCRVSNWKLFVNLGTLEIERREASKRISDERRESEERYKAEQAKIIKDLEREKAQIQDELSDLQGLFTSKRRRALESRLAEIVTKPDRPSGRTRQRRAGQGLRLGENTLCQSLNTPCRPQPDV